MEIQLFDVPCILPHSSEWDEVFKGYEIALVEGIADDDDDDRIDRPGADGRTFTDLNTGQVYRMPEGKCFYARNSLWRITSQTNPADTFLMVTFDDGNGWEGFEATDKPELFSRAIRPACLVEALAS